MRRALACLLLAGCATEPGGIVLTVDADGAVPAIAELRVTVTSGATKSLPVVVPLYGVTIPPAVSVFLRLPPDRAGVLRVDVAAMDAERVLAIAAGETRVEAGGRAELRVVLGGAVVVDAGADLGGDLAHPDATTDAARDDLSDAGADLADAGGDLAADLAMPDLARPDLAAASDLSPVPMSSCLNLPPTCGPTASDDCCASLMVPGGTFYRSYDGTAQYNDRGYPATVSTFRLDRYEATVGRYRRFVEAVRAGWQPSRGVGAHPRIAGSGWGETGSGWSLSSADDLTAGAKCEATYQTWTDAAGQGDRRPINCLAWAEAFAFCAWDGGRLPTEAEWNFAAANGDEQRAYPWSSPPTSTSIDGTRAAYNAGVLAPLQAVGTHPAGDARWGHSDMAGSVGEWMLDAYAPYVAVCPNCATLGDGNHAVRGGGFGDAAPSLRVGYRTENRNRTASIGVRCARD